MDKQIRNLIQKAMQEARRLLESVFAEQLQGIFAILPSPPAPLIAFDLLFNWG
jgi:hypothetical protein